MAPSSAKIGKRYGNSVIQFAAAMPTRQEEPTAAAAAKNSRDTHGILIKRVLLFSRAGIRVCLSDDASYGECELTILGAFLHLLLMPFYF